MARIIKILLMVLAGLGDAQAVMTPYSIEERKVVISGYVKDAGTGEALPGVTVIETGSRTGNYTNVNGFYTIAITPGNYDLQFSFVGYEPVNKSGNTLKNLSLDVVMSFSETQLGEVIVEGKRRSANVTSPVTSMVELDMKTIRMVPSLLGEVDLLKVIQLMPGVQSVSEGSTGFSVRGGSADQNLILLDGATVYNASHLLGFFSVFNNDAVKDVTLYKGDIPAAYGGRLSSLVDVEMREGSLKGFEMTGSAGTVSSKLTVEGPVIKEKTAILAAGRRTYADIFLPLARDESVRDNRLYFYDLNLKILHKINERNRLYLSGYSGKDVFRNQFSKVGFGNRTGSLRWNHMISDRIFYNLSLIFSDYRYNLGTPEEGSFSFNWLSELSEYSARFDLTHYPAKKHTLRYGASVALRKLRPGSITGFGNSSANSDFILPLSSAYESGLYVSDDFSITERFTLKAGIRFSAFQNAGPATVYRYDDDYMPADSNVYRRGGIYNTYATIEPRIAFTYLLSEASSVKGSYTRSAQYLALAQNSTAGTPLDVWFFAGPNVKPQLSDQYASGYFRNFSDDMYEVSAEVYYKDLRQLIDFRDHAQLFLNQFLDGELRIGRGHSYGIETIIRKNEGRLNGWLSYTWSRSYRIVPEINGGRKYVSPFDKPHNVNIVVSYEIFPRLAASATWVYSSGLPVTFPSGRALIGNALIPVYSDRNSYRLENYHRLDLSVTLRSREKPGKRWHSELNLSVYNAYNRHNTWAVNFVRDSTDPYVTYAEKTYLFSVIPALTYTIRFK